MRTTLLTILFAILCITTASGKPNSLYYELGAKGYELVLDMRYDEGDKIFDEMIRMEPKNAVGYLYKSQSYFHYWQYTFLNPDKKTLNQFKALLFKSKKIAAEMPDKENIETLFILGSAYGNIGLYYANTNNWFRAWWYGRKGIRYIEKIVKKDPEYYNAYFLLGMYNYYTATLPRVVKSLSFLLGGAEGNREKGIEQVIIASLNGDLKGDAKIFLADSVHFEEKNFEAASALLEELTVKYPNNHYLSLIQAVSCRHLNKYDLSVEILTSSLKSKSLKGFPYLHGEIYYTLGRSYSGMNEYDQAISAHKNAYEISKNLEGFIPGQYDTWALYEIGNAYEMLGAIDKAHEYYSKIKENNKSAFKSAQTSIKNPLSPSQINLIKGKKYLRHAKYSKAKTILRDLVNSELIKKSVNNTFIADVYLSLGVVEYYLKEYQSAIQILQKVFTFDDVMEEGIKPWSHYWLASCYREIGDLKKAEQEYDIAYKYNDDGIRSKIEKARKEMK